MVFLKCKVLLLSFLKENLEIENVFLVKFRKNYLTVSEKGQTMIVDCKLSEKLCCHL